MTQGIISRGFRSFLLVWFGQLISITGSGLTGFGLGVWVYQRTGSVTQFALISLFTTLPGILFSPIAGTLVDRWDRRKAMILSDGGAAVCVLSMAVLLLAGRLQVWEIYIVMAIKSTVTAFQWPAYSAATTLLIPKKHLARASGLVQIADAVALIGSPAIAGALMGAVHIYGVMLIDFSTFIFALLTLLITRFPKPEISAESKAVQGSLLREAAFGWTYIVARPGLLGLLVYFAAINFCSGFVQVLFIPMVLNFFSPAVLGMILSIGGIGFLGGSLTMSIWGGPRRRIYSILGFSLLQGAVLFVAGFPPRVAILAAAAFFIYISMPIINGCSQVIWQSKTAPDVQGRVFATRRMIAWSSMPLAYLFAGPLADRVFEPLLAEGGLLSSSVGRIIGVGQGRGIGLMFIIFGIMILLATGAGFSYPRLRRVETELPDVIADKVPVPAVE